MSSIIRGSDNFDSLASSGLGDGQTWQDVTASRSMGVTYTNTTGKAIYLMIRSESASTTSAIAIYIDSLPAILTTISTTARSGITTIIPNGSTYSITRTGGVLTSWHELR